MNATSFSRDFQSLIQTALKSGTPIHQIVMSLEMAKIELGHMHCLAIQQAQMQNLASQMASDTPRIIPPNTN
jgi:hypothetical protein